MDIELIEEIFARQCYLWQIDGELALPTKDDIRQTLDRMVEVLQNEPDNSAIDVGYLRVQRINGRLETYIYMGDL